MVVSGLSRVGFGLFIDMMFLRVYLGLRRKKRQGKAEKQKIAGKQKSGEAEK